MNKQTLATILLAIATSTTLYSFQNQEPVTTIPQKVVIAFNEWKRGRNRFYGSPSEENHRLNVFYKNYQMVESVNSQNLSYTFGLNDFSDLSSEEFAAKYLQKAEKFVCPEGVEWITRENSNLNTSLKQSGDFDFNHCDQNAVPRVCSAVRTQGNCAAGYAFSTAKVLEYAFNKFAKGPGLWLSPQEYVDCSANFGNAACNGGNIVNSLQYSMNYGLRQDSAYPYTDVFGRCQPLTTKQNAPLNIRGVNYDNALLEDAVRNQPVSVAIDASQL